MITPSTPPLLALLQLILPFHFETSISIVTFLLKPLIPDGADAEQIIEYAGRYIGWIIIIPLAASWPFMMDGIMVGATQSRIMRNSMLWATAAYFLLFYTLEPLIGNNALWLAFTSYMFLRGVFQYFMSERLQVVYRQAEE